MVDNTEFHEFQQWQDNEEPWEHNTDFDKLDKRLELRGALSERPSSAPDGAKFVVDDSSSEHDGKRFIYRADSDSWEHRPGNFSSVSTETASIGKVGAKVGLSANQTVSSGTDTKIQLDVVSYDHFNAFDTDNHNYVAPADGAYFYSGVIRYDSLPDGTPITTRIVINGETEGLTVQTVGANDDYSASVSAIIEANEGDEIALFARHFSGSDETVEGNELWTFMSIGRLG